MSKRITKKQLKEDEVVSGIERGWEFVAEHQREFGIAAASVLGVVVVVVLGMGYQQRRANSASHLLAQAMTIYDAPVVGDASTTAKPGAKTYASRAEKLREALGALEKVRQQYGSTTSGKVATYYVGLCHLGLGDAEQAAQALDGIKGDKSPFVAGLVRLTMASLARDQKKPEMAAELLQDKRFAFPSDAAMFLHALALEDQAKRSAAIAMYKDLQKSFPESPWRSAAKDRIGVLEGQESASPAVSPS